MKSADKIMVTEGRLHEVKLHKFYNRTAG